MTAPSPKTATENFQELEKKLGTKDFNSLYKGKTPRVFEVVDIADDEVCVLEPFEVYGKGTQFFKIWSNKNRFILN